jgi:hypothetical protein
MPPVKYWEIVGRNSLLPVGLGAIAAPSKGSEDLLQAIGTLSYLATWCI